MAQRARTTVKRLTRSVVRAPHDWRRVVLIFGCQRSGTTMVQQTFLDLSWRVLILGEHDRRLVGEDPIETSWGDHSVVFHLISRLPFEVDAVKPLVESSRAIDLMGAAGDSLAIWMLRHYRDVALSNVIASVLATPIETYAPSSSEMRSTGESEAPHEKPARQSSG